MGNTPISRKGTAGRQASARRLARFHFISPLTPLRRKLFCHWRGTQVAKRRQRRRHSTLALSQFQLLSSGRGRRQRVERYLFGLSTHRFHLPQPCPRFLELSYAVAASPPP